MPQSLDYLKQNGQQAILGIPNALARYVGYETKMVNKAPKHDWYLVEWCIAKGKRQADLVADLEWNASKASLFWKGKQRYHRDDVNQIAAYLDVEPFELLMHPEDAGAIKQLRIAAGRIAAVRLVADIQKREGDDDTGNERKNFR